MKRTFGMIKPDAVGGNLTGRILAHIEAAGLRLEAARLVRLSEAQARGFYEMHRLEDWFDELVTFMTSGPVLLMVLSGEEAVTRYRALMGHTDPAKAAPNTIRALHAASKGENAVHGADSPESAEREIDFFRQALSPWI